jgi:hypothetical protein
MVLKDEEYLKRNELQLVADRLNIKTAKQQKEIRKLIAKITR